MWLNVINQPFGDLFFGFHGDLSSNQWDLFCGCMIVYGVVGVLEHLSIFPFIGNNHSN